jgi:DNA-binding transcriptional MocR family regulator
MKASKLSQFVPLLIETMETPAWRAMSPAARCLYLALKRRCSARNNGKVFISQRDGAKELGLSRPTVARGYQELEHYGFTVKTAAASLGTDGKGRAPHWRLTELETASAPPTMDFKNWDGTLFQRPRRRGPPRNRPRASATIAGQAS